MLISDHLKLDLKLVSKADKVCQVVTVFVRQVDRTCVQMGVGKEKTVGLFMPLVSTWSRNSHQIDNTLDNKTSCNAFQQTKIM